MRRVVAAALLAVVFGAGCDLQTAGAPKGSTKLYATFDDAQHLVSGHAVKVADVTVGTITAVSLMHDSNHYRARVTMSIVDGRHIPRGTTAALSQTSLLGENYVQLRFPENFDPQSGPFLASGDEITDTQVEPTIEYVTQQAIEAFGAIETGDLASIVKTLATGLGGKGEQLHELIAELAQVGSAFSSQSSDLAAIVDGLGRLGHDLASGSDDIGALVDNVAAATTVLAQQRERFVDALSELNRLATALNTSVIEPHGSELARILKELDPVAATLAANRDTIGQLLSNLTVVSERAPYATDASGAILIYGWLTGLILPGGTTVPLLPSGTSAINSLLEPPS